MLLTPERAAHTITPTPDGIATSWTLYSTPTQPQTTVVRDVTGKIAVSVAHEDITKLKATGWLAPVQIQVKARDGRTDLYGLIVPADELHDRRALPDHQVMCIRVRRRGRAGRATSWRRMVICSRWRSLASS